MLTVIHTSWNASNCLSECKQYYFVQDAYFNWEMYIFHASGSVRVDHLRAPIQFKAVQRVVLVVNVDGYKVI